MLSDVWGARPKPLEINWRTHWRAGSCQCGRIETVGEQPAADYHPPEIRLGRAGLWITHIPHIPFTYAYELALKLLWHGSSDTPSYKQRPIE